MNFFLKYVLRILILAIGLIGNLIGIIIFSRKSFRKKIKSCLLYILVASNNMIYLVFRILVDLLINFEIKLRTLSNTSCKLIRYLDFVIGPISSWLLVFISIEKFISIKYPSRKHILRSTKNQIAFFICILIYNSVFYLPVYFYYDLFTVNNSTYCALIGDHQGLIVNTMNFINKIVLPEFLMVLSSILLIYFVYQSRNTTNRSFVKDKRMVISLVVLNLNYIIFSLPLTIAYYSNSSPFIITFTFYLFYSNYAVNFYNLLITNSLFRKTFFELIRKKFRFH